MLQIEGGGSLGLVFVAIIAAGSEEWYGRVPAWIKEADHDGWSTFWDTSVLALGFEARLTADLMILERLDSWIGSVRISVSSDGKLSFRKALFFILDETAKPTSNLGLNQSAVGTEGTAVSDSWVSVLRPLEVSAFVLSISSVATACVCSSAALTNDLRFSLVVDEPGLAIIFHCSNLFLPFTTASLACLVFTFLQATII